MLLVFHACFCLRMDHLQPCNIFSTKNTHNAFVLWNITRWPQLMFWRHSMIACRSFSVYANCLTSAVTQCSGLTLSSHLPSTAYMAAHVSKGCTGESLLSWFSAPFVSMRASFTVLACRHRCLSVCLTVFFCILLPLSLSFLLALVRLIYNLHTFSWSWSHFAFSSDLSISSRPPPPHLPPVTCVYVFPCYLLCLYCTYFCWSHSYLTFDCSLYFSPIFAVSCVYVFPCSL